MPPRPPRGASGPRGGGRGAPPGLGRGRGGGPPQGGPPAAPVTPSASAGRGGQQVVLADHVQTIGVRKPGYGREGRIFKVFTNHFAAEVTDNIISHYDGQ